MITIELAQQLLAAGLVWEPAPGDRFVVPDRGMDEEVFVVSQMTIEVHERPEGRLIGFNGTTEWAMDSLELTDVLWLPAEGRLRQELGDRFGGLYPDGDNWVVTVLPALKIVGPGSGNRNGAGVKGPDHVGRRDSATEHRDNATEHRHPDAECAYALAVLEVLDF